MHDPYFLTWIIRTDFFGDFVQFHAVYTKNIHKLEDFLGQIDVFVILNYSYSMVFVFFHSFYFEFEIRFYIWSRVRVQYIDPMEYKWKRNRSFWYDMYVDGDHQQVFKTKYLEN